MLLMNWRFAPPDENEIALFWYEEQGCWEASWTNPCDESPYPEYDIDRAVAITKLQASVERLLRQQAA